jgi:hypothetical protein
MNRKISKKGPLVLAAILGLAPLLCAADRDASNAPAAEPPVFVTVTATAKHEQPPALTKNDVEIYTGKERVQLADFKRGDTLYLGILIDDSLRSSIATRFDDLRQFMMAQSPSTFIAVAYTRNGSALIAQDFTTDHALAAKSLRTPIGNGSVATSPYLALQDWMKHWPAHADQGQRSSIVLFSSGIDFVRGGFPPEDPDIDPTIAHAQKQNINVWTIYVPDAGAGFRGERGAFGFYSQSNIARVSQETGAESYYLGWGVPVDLRPYLDSINAHLNNQYLLAFIGDGGKKGKYQPMKVTSELRNVSIMSPAEVYLPATR